ncbi:MAG TPA: hypothetical protein VLK33_00585 [Terriglobales bacterium]|nr:hypothetical protein [Terriglobales bacterium]
MNENKESCPRVNIGDLLTDDQVGQVCAIFAALPENQTDLVRDLKAYLETLRVQLEAKGVDPNYLAYALVHTVQLKLKPNNN